MPGGFPVSSSAFAAHTMTQPICPDISGDISGDMSLAPLRQRNGELEQQLAACRSALALAQQELDRLASLDNLTQTANRRRFDQRLYHEWKRLAREKQPLSLILVEVDRFRAYGDRYGSLAADQCLYRVAQMLRAIALRPADLVSRYSGEVLRCCCQGHLWRGWKPWHSVFIGGCLSFRLISSSMISRVFASIRNAYCNRDRPASFRSPSAWVWPVPVPRARCCRRRCSNMPMKPSWRPKRDGGAIASLRVSRRFRISRTNAVCPYGNFG